MFVCLSCSSFFKNCVMSLELLLAVRVSENLEASLAASSVFSLPTSPMWLGTQTIDLVTRFLTEVA